MKTKLLENLLNKATYELVLLTAKQLATRKEVDDLKTANTALDTKNAELETRLDALESK